ncbi:hypothetical protein PILCRDRAFT_78818 [Piloderma croceum F 1598]|uniref:Uncharacterized protein n=1 Tax=Piloderma croceum (strain F 1598) TaxID=765440 RepID=A0A0C3BDR4_PILCF|nr:hypothetical protein PILCRDRAFT_78818 [Piloderma croceum F 1598]
MPLPLPSRFVSFLDNHVLQLTSTQPRPDPSLLNTQPSTADNIADDAAKVNVVSADFKSNPATYTSEGRLAVDEEYDDLVTDYNDRKYKTKKKANKAYREAEAEGEYIWEVTKQYLLRPGVAGGLIGLVNVGIIAAVGHAYYTEPHLRRDTTTVSATALGALTLLSIEGYAAEKYRKTPRGQDEERKAKEEGALLYRHAREIVLRPGVLGGLVGLVNTAILGTVGYYSFANWDKPSWDRRTVSALSAGLIALWGTEGRVFIPPHAITISLMRGSTDTLQNAIANRDVDLTLGLETDSSIMIRPTLYNNPCILFLTTISAGLRFSLVKPTLHPSRKPARIVPLQVVFANLQAFRSAYSLALVAIHKL